MPSPTSNYSFSVPTTNIWDLSAIENVDVNSPEFRELLVRLYQNVNNIALAVNAKDTGYYDVNQYLNNQVYFPNPTTNSGTSSTSAWRTVSRKVINFGALPNAGTKSVAHNINFSTAFSATRIYGAATNPTSLLYIPLPYSSGTLNRNIELEVDSTNVTVVTSIDWSAYTLVYIVIEFLQS